MHMSNDKGNRVKDKKSYMDKSANAYKAYQYFINKGLTKEQAAGIVGNLAQESGLGLNSGIENEIGAYGIAQWYKKRRTNLNQFAKDRGKDTSDFSTQLDFMWHELNTTEKRALNHLKTTQTVDEAAESFVNKFERSGEKRGDKGFEKRITYANQFYTGFTGDIPVSSPRELPNNTSPKQKNNEVQETNPNSNNSTTPFDTKVEPNNFELLRALELDKLEREKQQRELKEVEYKRNLQNKINERNALAELVSTIDVPFVQMNRSGEKFQEGGEKEGSTDSLLNKLRASRTYKVKNERQEAVQKTDGTDVQPNITKSYRPKKKLTLEEQEYINRNIKPDPSLLEKASDYVKGNADEYIFNPAKSFISNFLPDTVKYDPNLTTTRSNYDDSNGTHKYLLDNKTIGEIRKEKNLSFAQISNSKESNHFIPMKLKKRIVNSIYPQGYSTDPNGFLERFNSEESKGDSQIKRLEGKVGDHREDIFLMYTGLPQKHDSFTISSFKAGENSDSNVTFKDPETVASYLKTAALHTDLFDKLLDGTITPEKIEEEKQSDLKGGDKTNKASFRDPQNVMWNATFGIGYDETGNPYLSFYDNWDLAGKDDNKLTKGVFGSPIEIYDRISLTPSLIKSLAKFKKNIKPNDESDSTSKSTDSFNGMEKAFKEGFKNDPELKKEYEKVVNTLKERLR